MSSTSVQSRVKAFESLAGPSSQTKSSPMPISISRPPPTLDDLLETPLSPTASKLPTMAPHTPPHPKRSVSSPSPSPPNLGRKTSLIDLKDWVVDDGPVPPKPSMVKMNGKSSRSNGVHDTPRKDTYSSVAPLINFESPPKAPPLPPRKPSNPNLKTASSVSPPSKPSKPAVAPKPALLPLVTRRSDSLTVEHTYPPLKLDLSRSGGNGKAGHAPASSVSSFHSVSLSSDTDPSTPGSVAGFIATYPIDHDGQENGHEHGEPDADSVSLDESFENVSTTSLGSPVLIKTMDWTKSQTSSLGSGSKPAPPKLPQRPSTVAPSSASSSRPPSVKSPPPHPSRSSSTASTASSFTSITSTTGARRAPPPPPTSRASTASDRSSILSNLSNATSTSITSSSTHNTRSTSTQTIPGSKTGPSSLPKLILNNASLSSRRTPVPAVAQKRFEAVFDQNVIQRRKAEARRQKDKPSLLSPAMAMPRKARQAAGWRGLSIDLVTGGEDTTHPLSNGDVKADGEGEEVDTHVGPEERLEGRVVKVIWNRSRLGKDKLSNIWSECDPTNSGSLNRESFVKAMWRIDEELRRAQLQQRGPGSATSLSSMSSWASASGRTPTPIRISTSGTARPRDLLR